MPGFEDVLHLQLEKLSEAAEDWDRQVSALESGGSGMLGRAQTMAQRARTVNWSGVNASVTLPFVTEQAEQFDAALIQARTLRELCRDAYIRLRSRQDALREVVEVEAPARGVHVRASGGVTADYEGLDDATRRERQEAVIEISAEIERLLTRTVEDDAVIAQAFRDAMGTDPYRFTPVDYGSLEAAELAHQDAETVLRLMEQGGDLSDEQLAYVSTLLGQHADDPAFAERVATTLGPRGALDFWYGATGSRDIREDSDLYEAFAELQTNLGSVLGTATRSDSTAMERWEDEMLTLVPNRLGGAPDAPYGFQVMSALMNTGEYETDFLLEYGDALLTLERDAGRPAGQFWDAPYLPPLDFPTERDEEGNLIDAGNIGHDPVIGFLNALGHNPEASTRFFAAPDDFDPLAGVDLDDADSVRENRDRLNDHLAYLATEREWWRSVDHQGPPDPRPAHPSLGNALLAAAAGYPAEGVGPENATADFRTLEAQGVMEQVMHLYGSLDPTLLNRQPEMAASLGAMTASYMNDVDYWVSGDTETARGLLSDTFSSPFAERLGNGSLGTVRFLSVLGQQEDSHRAVTLAQQIYTLGNLDAFPADAENVEAGVQSLRVAADVRGILDYARVEHVNAEYGAETTAAQEALGRTGGWVKSLGGALISGGVGAGVALVAGPLTGGASLVVPVAAGVAGGFLTESLNQSTDRALNPGTDPARQENMTERQFYDAGSMELAELKDRYFADADDLSPDEVLGMLTSLDDAYQHGQGLAANHGY